VQGFDLGEHGTAFRAGFTDPLAGLSCLEVGLAPGADEQSFRVLLGMGVRLLERQLELEEVRAERDEVAEVGTAGEAVLGMLHTLNNHLNSMMLQAAAVQLRLAEPLRSEMQNIRREGTEAAARLRPLQTVRELPDGRGTADLNLLLAAVVREQPAWAQRLTVDATEVPSLQLPAASLLRLLRLLSRVAVGCQNSTRAVAVRTRCEGNEVKLLLELDGVQVSPESRGRLVDLPLNFGPGTTELERIAAQSLIRRLEGTVTVNNRATGLVISVAWPITKPEGEHNHPR
jgi:hypothetical protein